MTKRKKPINNSDKTLNDKNLAQFERNQILNALPEGALDHITKAASEFCDTEISLISLVDSSSQTVLSSVSLSDSEMQPNSEFCAQAINQPNKIMEVEDTTLDPRFSDNPLVTDNQSIRFYAGVPLTTPQGNSFGTLCVIDSKPRKLTNSQKEGLKHLSAAVTELLNDHLGTTLTPLGRAIEDTLNNGIIITDASMADNPITYCNKGFEKLSGYSREEIIGKNCRFLQGDETDPVELEKLRNAVANHQECTIRLKNFRKDGTPFWNELLVSPVRNNEGSVTHFFGIQQDISAQREAEERILGFSNILEDSLNEIYIFDAVTLKFIQVNKGARKNLGYSMTELLTMTSVDIKPEHTESSFQEIIKPLTTGEKQKIVFNTFHRRKDGSDYLVEVHLQKMQFQDQPVLVAIILDITERTQNQLELAQAHAFLDSAPDATVVVDESGNIRVSNQQMTELLGYSQEELLGMNVDAFLPDRYRDGHSAHRADFANNPKRRGMGADMDLSAMTKDGREIPIEVSLSPIKTADGALVTAAIRDISARKAFEEELRIAKQEAEDATVAKTRFLATASHDLRQPLQAIRLYLSALTSKLEEPKAFQLSEKMNLSLDTMGELLDALLDISTLESGSVTADKRDVKLSEVLDRIIADNSQQAKKKGLQFECEGLDCIVYTDPILLQRIIDNFITNAIRYTKKGKISLKGQLSKDTVCITVSDTGVGIQEHNLGGIFDEFVQLDNAVRSSSKGLGLGLSIVKHIARILEHPTKVTSVIGEGSSFSVEIPLSKS